MNVDREDELRIQAPPGAASASESWLQLDGTGLMPEGVVLATSVDLWRLWLSLSSSQNRLVRSHGDRQRRDLGLRPVVPWIFSVSVFGFSLPCVCSCAPCLWSLRTTVSPVRFHVATTTKSMVHLS